MYALLTGPITQLDQPLHMAWERGNLHQMRDATKGASSRQGGERACNVRRWQNAECY